MLLSSLIKIDSLHIVWYYREGLMGRFSLLTPCPTGHAYNCGVSMIDKILILLALLVILWAFDNLRPGGL